MSQPAQGFPLVHRRLDGIDWLLRSEFASRLEQLLQTPGSIVKQSRVKQVTAHQLGPDLFYLKRYVHRAVPLRPLKYLLLPTQAREEWALAELLEARQIPIVRHVALGERRTWGGVQESLLITEGFAGKPLDQIPEVDPQAVLAFVRSLHQQGVIQHDLHPANLLVRKDPFEIRLVDLHGAEVRTSLTEEERRANLAMLRVTYPIPVPPDIEEQSRRLRRILLFQRSRRSLRTNHDFAPHTVGALRWQLRLSCLNPAVQRLLEDPDGFLGSRAEILKPGRTATVGKADQLVLKRYNLRKIQNLLKDLFRPSRARRAFRAAYHLELAGIVTARPIAVASRRCCGFLLRSYLLMEEILGAQDLGTCLRTGAPPGTSLIRATARLVANLHEQGFSHRDLKETNLVLGADQRLYLIDLDGLRFHGEVPEARAAADLMRLARAMTKYAAVATPHRVLFLLAYCRARRLRRVPHEL